MAIKKIAYLLGAGATHAEIMNLSKAPDELYIRRNGLLISSVSKRVMEVAQSDSRFKKNVETVTSREGSLNIELLISLIESNSIEGGDFKITRLKKLVREDIIKQLSISKKKKFFLHKALFELHEKISSKEDVLGFISLNYDDILDDAYKSVRGTEPNYCLTSEKGLDIPLLKLHGSFNWRRKKLYHKSKDISIVPLGINKNYLKPPYNFIWGRAFELLLQCDILRIIGCALNPSDLGLIDLLFKAHLDREVPIEIQIIDFEKQGEYVKNNYGFFPGITKPKDIEGALIADEAILKGEGNPFKIWLRAKAEREIVDNISQTKYLKKCF